MLLPAIAFLACTPYLVPLDFSVAELNNQAVIEVDSVTFAFEHLESSSVFRIFNLEVTNHRDTSVYLDLNQLRFLSSENTLVDSSGDFRITHAMTPQAINNHYRSQAQNAQIAMGLLLVAGTALIISDAVKDNKESSDEVKTDREWKDSRNRDALTYAGLKTIELTGDLLTIARESAYEELHYLPDELFLNERIGAGERYFGKVFIRKPPTSAGSTVPVTFRFFRICLPFENKTLFFDFRNTRSNERSVINQSRIGY